MSRPAAFAIAALVLVVGFVAGRASGRGAGSTVTEQQTVERTVVVSAQNVHAVTDARDPGPLDLARVSSTRQGLLLRTTIVAHRPWSVSLIRSRRVELSVLYDRNDDGTADRRDIVGYFDGRLTAWILTYGQGAARAEVVRRGGDTIVIDRDVSILFNASGQAPQALTSPIGVAVVARWRGGSDRAPDRGWITVPPPG